MYAMYIIMFALLFGGMVFHEILAPICAFLSQYSILVFIFCAAIIGVWCYRESKKLARPLYGIGIFLTLSQFAVFALAVLYAVVDTMSTEEDPVMAMLMTLLVCAVFGAYGSFNLKMVRSAITEGRSNNAYPLIVGIVGWGVNLIFTLL